jgi:hypothetical protein
MIKYKANILATGIYPVEIVSETEYDVKFIDAAGHSRYDQKRGNYSHYFDTWKEAHEWLKEKANANLEETKDNRQAAERLMDKVLDMIPPEDTTKP